MTTNKFIPIRRALLSVSDKTGLLELAETLTNARVEILSTGGTARLLRDANIDVIDVADVTGLNTASENSWRIAGTA